MRWGGIYEIFGIDPEIVGMFSAAYIEGLQSRSFRSWLVVGTAKHYLGNGAMAWNSSHDSNFKMDQGVIYVDG